MPPFVACRFITRFRCRCPPLQSQEHEPQVSQSAHSQSTVLQMGCTHGLVFSVAAEHPWPSCSACFRICLLAICWPAPHVTLHSPKVDQSLRTQSSPEQAVVLQPWTSTRSTGQCFPPFFGFFTICLCRCCWPPPQFLSHSSHSLQSDTSQSTFEQQRPISLSDPVHGIPPFFISLMTLRVRSFWCVSSVQADQACQRLIKQSTFGPSVAQGSALQGKSSSSASSQPTPPRQARVSMRLDLSLTPPPHDLEQSPQEFQSCI